MKSYGILMSKPMVLALIAGRKTQTRRLSDKWLKLKNGDELWIRETWTGTWLGDGTMHLVYAADVAERIVRPPSEYVLPPAAAKVGNWVSPLFMPRWASRITLVATEDARQERLQDISEEDAIAEGVEPLVMTEQDVADSQISDESPDMKLLARLMGPGQFSHRFEYQILWGSLHGKKDPWESNPLVTRLAFTEKAAPSEQAAKETL